MTSQTLLRACEIPDGGVLVALSGGADSTALVVALAEVAGADRLTAFHLNHSLRGDESDRDEAFCRALCDKLGVRFCCKRVAVADDRQQGETLEQAARRVRYDAFCDYALEYGCTSVATAHTASDAAETVLMNLARGTGMSGAAGIPLARPLCDGVMLIRPMLCATRADVETYLAERGQDYVTDSTNLTDDYTRNVVRHHAVPALERVNPRAVEHIASAAELIRDDDAFLDSLAQRWMDTSRLDDSAYDAETIAMTPRPLARRILRLAYSDYTDGEVLARVHVEALERLCASDDPSAEASLPNGVVARREYRKLVFTGETAQAVVGEVALEVGDTEFGGYNVAVRETDAPDILTSFGYEPGRPIYLKPGDYTLRTRREGDFIRPKGRGYDKSIKKLFVELKIPAHLRDGYPLVFPCGDDCQAAAIPGYAPGEGFAARPGERALELRVTAK